MLPAAIFWDMDGTLVDTEPIWGIATYELSERLGRRLTPELRQSTVGGSFANTLRVVADHAGVRLRESDYDSHKSWMYQRMAELLAGRVQPNPGVHEFLLSLRATGIPMIVTTNTERVLADVCIDAVGREFFTDSITGDEVARPKPAPDMYLEASRRAAAAPKDCVVFEDSLAGMTAARNAGCTVLGLADEVPSGVISLDPKLFVSAEPADIAHWVATARCADVVD